MDATATKLIQLLNPDQAAEVRAAAALTLGEVGGSDKKLADALCHSLADPDALVRQRVITAIGKLKIDAALPLLTDKASHGGEEGEAAAIAAARLGAKGIRAIQKLMDTVPPGLKRRLATALAAAGTTSSESAALDNLLDSDPGVVEASVRTLIDQVPSFSASQRKVLIEHVIDLLKPKKTKALAAASEAALLRLLAATGDPRGEALFWARAEPGHAIDLRAAALQALGGLPPPDDKKKLLRLFDCAVDTDFRIAAPALMILKTIAVSGKAGQDWLPLLQAPDVAVRRFAIEKLGDADTPAVAAGLLEQLRHPDRSLRDAALARLTKMKHGQEALVGALLEVNSADEAWFLARAQADLKHTAATHKRLLERACQSLEGDGHVAEPILFVLRKADPAWVRDQLFDRAVAYRKKKKYDEALIYLKLLIRDPSAGEPIRQELAACGLHLSAKDLAPEARAADPALQQFARLVHNPDGEPLAFLKAAKWLEAEDLYYLGFHFAEGAGLDREFGGQVLKLLVQRSPNAKAAKDAKRKLKTLGW